MSSLNKNAARTALLLSAILIAAVPLTAAALRSRLRPVRSLKVHFLGGRLLADAGMEFQQGTADCGPTALRNVLALQGIRVSGHVRPANRGRAGWSPSQIVAASRAAGLSAATTQISKDRIATISAPAIVLLGTHYVVLERRTSGGGFIVIDPDLGRIQAGIDYMARNWTGYVVVFPTSSTQSNLRSDASAPERHHGRTGARHQSQPS